MHGPIIGLVLLSFSVVKLAKHSGCSTGPHSGTHIRWNIDVDDEVRRLAGRAKNTGTYASLVARASILINVAFVVLHRFEPDKRH